MAGMRGKRLDLTARPRRVHLKHDAVDSGYLRDYWGSLVYSHAQACMTGRFPLLGARGREKLESIPTEPGSSVSAARPIHCMDAERT